MKKNKNKADILEQYDFVDTDYMYDHLGEYEVFVGRYIILFSYVEHNVNTIISKLINEHTDELGYLVTTKMTMANKIDLIKRFSQLGSARNIEEYKKLGKLASRLMDANEFRNVIAHANWASMKKNGMVRVKTKIDDTEGVWFETRKVDTKEICERCHLLDELIHDLENDYEELY